MMLSGDVQWPAWGGLLAFVFGLVGVYAAGTLTAAWLAQMWARLAERWDGGEEDDPGEDEAEALEELPPDEAGVSAPPRHDWDPGCRERGCQVHGNWDLAELEPWRAEIAAAEAWWEELPSGTGYTRAMAARVRELTP